jgi:formylglycine-generating enzyme required for sulfatase activity
MPTLFISYKRGTTSVAAVMEKLKAAHYRVWFDRDDIHLGDPDWQAKIDDGLVRCDAVILNITPAACESEPVRYEVKKARELGKPIFPIILEKITDYDAALRDLGLPEKQHLEDFTDVARWDANIAKLLSDLVAGGLRVTPHDRRQQRDRDNPKYVLHQTYLKRLADRIGTLSLAQITPEHARATALEDVYVDSPTGLALSVEVKDWRVMAWWVARAADNEEDKPQERLAPKAMGYDPTPLEALLGRVEEEIEAYRKQYPKEKPDDWRNRWRNGEHRTVFNLHLNHLAAASNRLVILGAPGSGKSTFVKFLALCLAGAGIDGWGRAANLSALDHWPHGALTPVYVELRRFVASKHFPADLATPATADHLWAYLRDDLLGEDLNAYADDLRYDLEHGHALLILDGLDEVPVPDGKLKQRQAQLIGLAHSLNTRYAQSRVLVASRPYAYAGWALPGYTDVTITAFKDTHRQALAERLYRAAGRDEQEARAQSRALERQLNNIDDELKDRPLFVTLMATLFLQGGGLPTRRGALYRESIVLLLGRWTASKPNAPSLVELLGDRSMDDLYARLAALAYDVHDKYGDRRGVAEIEEGMLFTHLKPLGRGVAAGLIPYLSENAGVLVSPGQDATKDVFQFAHRTFQEYLAAEQLVRLCTQDDSYRKLYDHITQRPQVWRVVGVLAGDVLADTERRGDLWDVLDDLLGDDLPKPLPARDAAVWWAVWLASMIAEEQGLLVTGEKLRRSEQAVRDGLREWCLGAIQTGALPPVERAACGRALGLIGDTRFGVGLGADGLPEFDWVDIPAGTFIYGDDDKSKYPSYPKPADRQTLELPAFQISRYPLTYKQFQAFIDASDGFRDPRWWDGLAAKDDHKSAPREQAFKFWNHPREMVSWYDAIAFCRWMSFKLTGKVYRLDEVDAWPVRLPTEFEWEKAARGTDGREYPYEGAFDPNKGNGRETGIGQTSVVGMFPDGKSPYGLLDMSGNVWEWCLSAHDKPQFDLANKNLQNAVLRVLRGGSWVNTQDFLRAAYRDFVAPDNWVNFFGLRCARSPRTE